MSNTCSVIIPVYNSAGTLEELTARLEKVMPVIFSEYELILVNDCSRDESWKVIQSLAAKYPWVRGIDLMRNYGQHNALLCGILAAKYDAVITLDDDLQNPPEEISKLVTEYTKGYDVVYGTPAKEKHGAARDFASVFIKSVLAAVMGAKIARNVGAFRMFKTELRKSFEQYRGAYINIDVLLSWGTTNYGTVEVAHAYRNEGKSNYNFRKLVSHAINLVTGFSTLPLRIASLMGFLFTFFGIVILFYVLIRYLTIGTVVQGFAFLASVISIFAGAQLFALGIIGEYLARMYFRLMDKPKFVVRKTTDQE